MATGTFQQGRKVEISGKSYQLLQKVTDELWQLQELRTHRIVEMSDVQLRQTYSQGNLRFVDADQRLFEYNPERGREHRDVAEAAWELAKVRRAYVMAIIDLPSTKALVSPVIKALWLQLQQPAKEPGVTSVLRWKSQFLAADRDIYALVDNTHKKGNRKRRYTGEVLQLVEHAVETSYLTRERKTMQDTIDRAAALVIEENKLRPTTLALPLPKRRLVERLIAQVPAFDRHAARYGLTAATRKFRSVLGHRTTEAPLERAEIDHTLLDMFVIDDDTGLPLGRPWITACIDDYSRCILGLEVGFEPPSYLTVARCLKSAFLPKIDLQTQYPDIKNEWVAYGVMRELVVDNGLEFHSKSLENACLTLGIEMHYSARKTPWFKAKIERFFGTLNGGIAHGNPGTTFSNIFEKDDYDASKHAVIRLSKLQEIIRMWVVDFYHQKPHTTLQAPPAEVWRNGILPEDIRVPSDPADLDAILGRIEQRKLTHKGIELDGLLYNSSDLKDLRNRLGDKFDVEIRINDSDLGHVIVISPDKKRKFQVPALAFTYANKLTRWQHRICKRYAEQQLRQYDCEGWLLAKEAISRLIDGELQHKKASTRTRIARFKNGGLPAEEAVERETPATPAMVDSPAALKSSEAQANAKGVEPPAAPTPSRLRIHFQPRQRTRMASNTENNNDEGTPEE